METPTKVYSFIEILLSLIRVYPKREILPQILGEFSVLILLISYF